MTLELNKIYNMNCLVGMQQIPDKSIDMILCDLPYGTTANPWDSTIPFDLLWIQYERIIKDHGAIVLTASQPFTSALIMSNVKLYRHSWVWKKSRFANQVLAKKQPLKIHEDICVFSKMPVTYKPQGLMEYGKVTYQGTKVTDNLTNSKRNSKYIQEYTNYPRSILEFSSVGNTIHPTQKPVDLFEYLIKTYTEKGDTVLDNCMGSGTTAIAAINTERNYIGFEMNEEYYEKSLDRIKNNVTQVDLFEQPTN